MKKYKTFGELFTHIAELPKQAEKVEVLLAHNAAPLQYFLHLAMQKNIAWALPEGAPPFTPDKAPIGLSPSTLAREMRSLYVYLDLPTSTIPRARRELLFQELLERLHPSEAEMLIAVKDGTFMTKYKCPKAVILKAFPHLQVMPFQGRFFTT